MKKIIFILLSVITLSINAQDLSKIKNSENLEDAVDNWIYKISEGDELKGTSNTIDFTYITSDLEYVFEFIKYVDTNKIEMFILSRKGIFDYNSHKIVFGHCGIYNNDDILVEKLHGIAMKDDSNIFVYSILGNGDAIRIQNNLLGKKYEEKRQELINKIFNYIMNEKGYIRFIAEKYGEANMDINISCVNNE